MKKQLVSIGIVLLLLAMCIIPVAGCKRKCSVHITMKDGDVAEYTVSEGKTFTISPAKYDDFIFMGCYGNAAGYEDFRFVDHTGQSVEWKKEYPTELCCLYISTADLTISPEKLYVDQPFVLRSGSQTFEFAFDAAYAQYFAEHPDLRASMALKFSHYEEKPTILGVGFSNWSECRVVSGDRQLDDCSLSSNSGYTDYKKTFSLDVSSLTSGKICVTISRPSGNFSTGASYYRNFELTIKVQNGSANVSYETNGKSFVTTSQSDVVLKPVGDTSATIELQADPVTASLYQKYKPNYVQITVSFDDYGDKNSVFENWGNVEIVYQSKDGSTIYQSSSQISHNDTYRTDSFTYQINGNDFANLDRVNLRFWYDTPGLFSGNQSGLYYYIKNIKMTVVFP